MDRSVRIAVVGPVGDRLVGDLRSLPLSPTVHAWPTLCGDSEALARFQPDVLLAAFGAEAREEVGALRLLRNLWPHLAVVLLTDAANELSNTALANRLGARLLVHPNRPGELAAAIEQARHGGDRPRPEVFVDLARGVADEVNNPLMFVSGHLQLLRAGLDPVTERSRRDQVDAAQAGVQRIQAAVERLRLVSAAANGPRRPEAVDLAALLARAAAPTIDPAQGTTTLAIAEGPHQVTGDAEHLTAAVAAIVRFAGELAALGAATLLQLDALPAGQRLRLTGSGGGLANWQLPHSFEPYYPNRALRGQGHGLGLFLAQTVVLGHRGQATARRLPDGSLQFDFVLPS